MTIKKETIIIVREIFISFLLLVCILPVLSQSLLKGKVINEETKEPLPSVSVYLNNTTNGTISDKNGNFTIQNLPLGKFRLIASSIGYITYAKLIDTRVNSSEMVILMKPKPEELATVTVVPFDSEGWQKWGKLFTELFIGSNPNAVTCRLINPEVIHFRLNEDHTLTAVASEPLKIKNEELGYEIQYKLEEFVYDFTKNVVAYNGYALFKDLSLSHPAKAEKYARKRQEVYDGSLMQFMRVFFTNKLELNGYEMRSLGKIYNSEKARAKRQFSIHKDSIIRSALDTSYTLTFHAVGMTIRTADSTDYYKEILKQPDSLISNQLITADSVGFAVDSNTAGFYFPD
jgi:hypothetical protein